MVGAVFLVAAGLLIATGTNAQTLETLQEKQIKDCSGRSPQSIDSSQAEYDGSIHCLKKISIMEEQLEGKTISETCPEVNLHCDT